MRLSLAGCQPSIYAGDPPICPKCKWTMKIISVKDQPEVIKAIRQHVGLWETRKRPPPSEYHAEEQIPVYDCADIDDPFEAYLQKILHRV